MENQEEKKAQEDPNLSSEQPPKDSAEEELHQSHNKLFVAAFQYKPTIIEYLTTFFPKHLTDKMNLENLELDNTNYITRKMTEFFSDVVFYP
jgi:Putative transposase, YhgA-like